MPQLTDALVKKVSLVARPANRRPFHMLKHEKDTSMAKRPAAPEEPELKALPEDIAKHISQLTLAKAESTPEMRAVLEAIGTLAHSHPSIAIEDLMAVGHAAGLAKASKDTDDEDEDEELDEDEVKEEADKQDKAPAFIRQQGKKKDDVEKSAAPIDAGKAVDIEKSELVNMMKAQDAELKSLRKEFAKSQNELAVERNVRVTKSIKDELARELRNLVIDGDEIAPVIKAMRDAGNGEAATKLMGVLKSADAQLALGGQGGRSVFSVVGKSSRAGDGTRAMDRIHAETAKIAKSTGKATPFAMSDYLNTEQGKADWAEHEAEELR